MVLESGVESGVVFYIVMYFGLWYDVVKDLDYKNTRKCIWSGRNNLNSCFSIFRCLVIVIVCVPLMIIAQIIAQNPFFQVMGYPTLPYPILQICTCMFLHPAPCSAPAASLCPTAVKKPFSSVPMVPDMLHCLHTRGISAGNLFLFCFHYFLGLFPTSTRTISCHQPTTPTYIHTHSFHQHSVT